MPEFAYSVILPAYNPGPMIFEAISSITQQSLQPSELIVIDDGSHEPVTVPNIYRFVVSVIRQENRGFGGALNTGITHSKNNVVAFIDHDDLWSTTKIESQLPLLKGNISVVGGATRIEDSRTSPPTTKTVKDSRVFGACLFRKSAFSSVGLVAEDSNTGEPIEWWSRFSKTTLEVAFTEQTVLHRRIHGSNLGIVKARESQAGLLNRVRSHHENRHSGVPN